jgi:hypothetical protein
MVKSQYLIYVLIFLIPCSSISQTLYRSGKFLHHSTGGNIWGPNGSSTSVPIEISNYNTTHGYTGSNAVSLTEQGWPLNPWDNEWERWHRIFENQDPAANIQPILAANKIVVIKSCFPSSAMTGMGQPSDTLTYTIKSMYNYKWHWRHIVNVMAQHPENFFVIWTNAPLNAANTNANAAMLAKRFCTWAKDTLAQGLDPILGTFPPNIYVFNYFAKLTNASGYQMPQYAVSTTDSHPNAAATALVAPQFVNEIFDAAIAYEQGGSTLGVSPSSRSVPATAGSTTFTVTSNTNWAAQSNAGWCSVTPSGSGNGTITANYTANSETSSRTATITVSATGAANQTVTVVQAGGSATLFVTPSTQSVSATAGSTTYTVTSNTNWAAQSNAGWCTVTPSGSGNGTITANYTANPETTSRTATITVSATGAANQTVTVLQAGGSATLSVTPSTQSVSATAGSTTFTLTSNTNWAAQSNAGWCTVTPSGSGNGTITANYTANPETTSRTATITVSATGAANQTVTVVQAGGSATLSVTPSTQSVSATAGSTTFTVTSNTNWAAQSNAGWCTVTPSGSGNGTITANYTANPETTSRTATITVSATGVANQTVTVIQVGGSATLSVTPSTQSVSATAGSTTFTVTSNTNWAAQSNAGWCTVTPSGSGNGTITANYTANSETSSRTATITVSATGAANQTVTVVQAGGSATLSVTPSTQSVSATAGSTTFTVTSNTNWAAQSNAGWCTVMAEGSGDGNISANYLENTGTTSRMATITVSAEGVNDQLVTVVQIGTDPVLSVSPFNHDVLSSAGTCSFSVASNLNWNALSDSDWCVVTPSGSGNGVLMADYNENTDNSVRIATITISANGVSSQTVTVTQATMEVILNLTPQTQNVSASSGSTTFSVYSNTNWTAQTNAEWCSVTPSGSGNGVLGADYTANLTITERIALIIISAPGCSDQVATIIQAGAEATLSVEPPSVNVTAEAGFTTFTVTSNTDWAIQSDAEWCKTNPSGTGNGTILAVYEENDTSEDRTANLSVNVMGLSPQIVTVIQSGLVTGIRPLSENNVRLYPNPTDGKFALAGLKMNGETAFIAISDVYGRIVYSREFNDQDSEEIDLGWAGDGVYFIRITSGNRSFQTKIVVR